MEENRKFLKTYVWDEFRMEDTDQSQGVTHPPLQNEIPAKIQQIDLVDPVDFTVGQMPLIEAIRNRKSHRKFTNSSLTLEELSFLLWATQGVHEIWRAGVATRRTVPSGGSRHPFETYLVINRVDGLEPGLYKYLALDHKLYLITTENDLPERIGTACRNQKFVGTSAVVFIWTVIPYRSEWRYGKTSHKTIVLDAGHMGQNLYLACETINTGTCGIGSYNQDEINTLLGVDGEEEFVIYVAPCGKIE